ncbi:MAG: hypothetical protein PHO10_06195 [Gemmiger sp.]|nr:hypothetical protein [Gemmiger sp.]
MKRSRFLGVLALLVLVFGLCAMPANAQDYDTVLAQLGELQTLADTFIAEKGTQADPVVLTLSYTRVGDYNTSVWQMTAGVRDPEFESYVAEKNGDLAGLQGLGSVELPGGQGIDFGHLLASMNLVYNGIPITGSWGGDCMQLAQAYAGQAADSDGYVALMAGTFGIPDDGSTSKFGDQDLRADLDSINIGSELKKDSVIAEVIRQYYNDVSDYDRCYQFIGLSFGTADTGNQAAFRETVYNTLAKDAGMQFLLYMNQLWSADGWAITPEAEAPMRGASYVFADYLANAVNHEKVKSATATLMVTMGSDALADALAALGFGDAASAALSAGTAASAAESGVSPAGSDVGGAVSSALDGATQTLRGNFNVGIFQTVLLVLGGAALLLLLICVVMLVRRR